jgi:hypothetical protein
VVDVVIRPATVDDAAPLMENLRPSDVREVAAYGMSDPLRAATDSIRRSTLCWAALADGELAAVLGVSPVSPLQGIGSPWMMGTPVLDRHVKHMLVRAPVCVERMLDAYPHLANFVYVENRSSIRWLKRLGFTLHPPVPFGALSKPFHPFEMRQ